MVPEVIGCHMLDLSIALIMAVLPNQDRRAEEQQTHLTNIACDHQEPVRAGVLDKDQNHLKHQTPEARRSGNIVTMDVPPHFYRKKNVSGRSAMGHMIEDEGSQGYWRTFE